MDPSDNNPSSQQSLPYITSNNPLQFTIHLPNSTPNFTSIPNSNPSRDPNPNPNPNLNPNPHSDSISDQLLSLSIPTKRRRGRPRSTATSSLDQFSKTLVENSNLVRNLSARKNTASFDASDEIIVINKEATTEALIALTAGFPADSLTDEEIEAGVVSVVGGIEQVNYILIRNHILMKWRVNVWTWITKEMFYDVIPKHCYALLDSAHNYLVSRGYINFGVVPAIKDRIPAEPSKPSVIIIGAGLAGLAAARQLMLFGFKVTVLEGRKRAGGRVYSKKMEGGNKVAAADLGGSVLTGTLGNPLGILARQLSCTLHKVRDKCPLYRVDGKPVDQDLDHKVETAYNLLLEKASKLRQLMGEVSQDVSLGAALETFRQDYEDAVNEEEMSLFNWHLANLEYANAGLISKLSLAFWDQDDPFDMGGDHCFLPGGNGKLVHALSENVPILYEKIVHTIRYGTDGVQVGAGAQVFEGDMVLCTVPLGVLKGGSIKFMPELPQRKLDGIKRLGFGLLNKVAMLFPYVFWGTDLDTFGHLTDNSSSRGEFFLFYSYATVAGGPLLLALVAGEAAHKFETMPPTDAVTKVLQILKGIYEPQGIEVPEPIQTVCTRWGSDPFSLGSYSNVAVGSSGDDYDILAESVGDGRLFFAGEATNRRYPATMHGAFLSGLREAANIVHHAKARTMSLKIEKKPSKSTHYYASVLDDLFREPDLEFGSFSIIFARKSSDLESPAILRVTFCGPQTRNHDGIRPGRHLSNKLLFQQLQSQFNNQHELHVYTLLSKQQALDLREVRGGNEMRLNFLSEKLGVKLVGRKGLGPSVDSIIASVKAERGRRKPGTLKTGVMKSKDTTLRRKIVRKAKVVSGGNRTTSFPASSSRIKAVGSSTTTIPLTNLDLEPKPVCAIGSAASPSLNVRVNDDMESKSVGSSVHLLHNASIGDKFEGNFGSSTAPLLNVGGNTGSNSDGPMYPRNTYDDSTDTCVPPITGNLASQHTSGDGDMESMMLDGECRM
ncbi:protein FLOWERINGUS D isoform X2 [Solanum lycopersicum]|uniref:protein FLOWERINGUS D isoform X2 n=1 Tax=Solanum lycopersicum TaxID=4081 RepID=UPI000276A8CB|nr:protein FLOWERING LOCUS D isoform X2 [Solanum lycopersicum]